jgi:hypothetical protein
VLLSLEASILEVALALSLSPPDASSGLCLSRPKQVCDCLTTATLRSTDLHRGKWRGVILARLCGHICRKMSLARPARRSDSGSTLCTTLWSLGRCDFLSSKRSEDRRRQIFRKSATHSISHSSSRSVALHLAVSPLDLLNADRDANSWSAATLPTPMRQAHSRLRQLPSLLLLQRHHSVVAQLADLGCAVPAGARTSSQAGLPVPSPSRGDTRTAASAWSIPAAAPNA